MTKILELLDALLFVAVGATILAGVALFAYVWNRFDDDQPDSARFTAALAAGLIPPLAAGITLVGAFGGM